MDVKKVHAVEIANFFIRSGQGEYSPLKIQKLIYIASLLHIRRFGKSLVRESFQAWEYGPVISTLYHKLKQYGRLHVRRPIKTYDPAVLSDDQIEILKLVDESFGCMPPSKLVRITHDKDGAWAKNYVAGAKVSIPEEDIIDEARGIR